MNVQPPALAYMAIVVNLVWFGEMELIANLAEETQSLIQGSHDIRLQIHEQGKRLAHLQKEEAISVARFNSIIAVDKKLTNADKRKAALTELKSSDEEYLAIEAETETIRNEIELLRIELQFNTDMIKLNLALINAQQ